jgi:hypothetical protein
MYKYFFLYKDKDKHILINILMIQQIEHIKSSIQIHYKCMKGITLILLMIAAHDFSSSCVHKVQCQGPSQSHTTR